jgi:hypothetical protein
MKIKSEVLLYVLVFACLFLSCSSKKENKPDALRPLNESTIVALPVNEETADSSAENYSDETQLVVSPEYDEAARFLAGESMDETSALYEKANTVFYKKYAAEMSEGRKKHQSPNLARMRLWWKDHAVKNSERNILYPFSGPDILNVLAFFPDGDTYTLFGLEPTGAIPDPFNMSEEQINDGLNKIRYSLNSILRMNFFQTKHMKEDLGTDSFNGITGLMMLFLVQEGYTISDVRHVTINDESQLAGTDTNGKYLVPGVEISFRKGKGKLQTVRYFMLNIQDYYLKTKSPNFIPYIEAGKPYSTFLKSASYTMHNAYSYITIRTTILTLSNSVVQDDSGIPLSFFLPEEWEITLHGVYDKPIKLFEESTQPALRKAMKESSSGVLPFSYGYHYQQDKSHLMVVEKKQALDSITSGYPE